MEAGLESHFLYVRASKYLGIGELPYAQFNIFTFQ